MQIFFSVKKETSKQRKIPRNFRKLNDRDHLTIQIYFCVYSESFTALASTSATLWQLLLFVSTILGNTQAEAFCSTGSILLEGWAFLLSQTLTVMAIQATSVLCILPLEKATMNTYILSPIVIKTYTYVNLFAFIYIGQRKTGITNHISESENVPTSEKPNLTKYRILAEAAQ